ncbi:MAG TPA: ABC transporter permease [Salinivirgaceae bacterium]|nr:ABC transporter permease [Salinivirgaceae bacterium]HQA75982.1 ABC transporter permease [Salinivirgaceae bacterium]
MSSKTKRKGASKIVAYSGILLIIIFGTLSFLGYLITPDSSPNANSQLATISLQNPGTTVKALKVKNNNITQKKSIFHKWLWGADYEYRLIPYDSLKWDNISVTIYEKSDGNSNHVFEQTLLYHDILFQVSEPENYIIKGDMVVFTDITGKKLEENFIDMRKTINEQNLVKKRYLLGTDRFGRDMLSRLIIGGRVSLSVGFVAVLVSLVIGILLGLISGYYGGVIDKLIVWVINVFWSVPTLLLVIAVCMALGKGFWQIFLAIGLTMWVEVARVVRGKVLQLKNMEYIEAARVLGFSDFRIMLRHLLPNIVGPIMVISASNFAAAILIESGLSFLGIGIEPPAPTWGAMIRDHYGYIIVGKAWLAMTPGIAVMAMVWAFTVSGDYLRRVFKVD